MIRLLVIGFLLYGAYFATTSENDLISGLKNGSVALLIRGITSSELNERILDHYKKNVLKDDSVFTADAINTTMTDLNNDGKKDVIAIVESALTCGTGGCIASIFLENDLGELSAIPFAYAVRDIEVLESMTQGMHDLRVNKDSTSKLVWNGSTYVLEQI